MWMRAGAFVPARFLFSLCCFVIFGASPEMRRIKVSGDRQFSLSRVSQLG
jgi:hypothetical protein